jgi:hypothetical protein
MTNVVYPEIFKATSLRRTRDAERFNKNKKLVMAHNFLTGSFVMAWDPLRATKTEPRYEGPFKVIRRKTSGDYLIEGCDGSRYTRAANHLIETTQDAWDSVESGDPETIISYPTKITDSRHTDKGTEYLTHWENKAEPQWLLAKDFSSPLLINRFKRDSLKKTSKVSKALSKSQSHSHSQSQTVLNSSDETQARSPFDSASQGLPTALATLKSVRFAGDLPRKRGRPPKKPRH